MTKKVEPRIGFEPMCLIQNLITSQVQSTTMRPRQVLPYKIVRHTFQIELGECCFCTAGRGRTGTDITVQEILSLSWLPFHHRSIF